MSGWTFATLIGEGRIQALLAPTTFETIVDRITREMEVLCCHLCRYDETQFSRVVYCVCVCPSLFDLFFNSPNGYRGSYYRSPYGGLESNGAFIRCLLPKLLEWNVSNGKETDLGFAEESLTSPSAKAWLAESGLELCDRCIGEWRYPRDDTAEIFNSRWENEDSPNGYLGRKAPYHSKLKIIGAFLNAHHDEFIPARKRHRAREIHKCGWS